MKTFPNILPRARAQITLAALLLAFCSGCLTPNAPGPKIQDYPGRDKDPVSPDTDAFSVDDRVQIIFSGSSEPPQNHQERINADGTITLSLIGSVQAAGLTPQELEEEIQRRYVPQFFKRLSVSALREDRFYTVGGDVRQPGRLNYIGETTVLRAIAAAGHFTDFADLKDVKLTRKSGKKWRVNAVIAQKDDKFDPLVYPGDRIHVERRIW